MATLEESRNSLKLETTFCVHMFIFIWRKVLNHRVRVGLRELYKHIQVKLSGQQSSLYRGEWTEAWALL